MDIGPQSKGDDPFTKKCRLLQSKYRSQTLKELCGKGPKETSDTLYGNMLKNGQKTGSNFIPGAAFRYAKQRVEAKKSNKYLTIEEFRLFNNMLSSMPMCFNLFSDLRELLMNNKDEGTKVIKQLFQEIPWIETAHEIEVEFIPIPIADYTNDKSAFDAVIFAENRKGIKSLISIETKYTDLLGSNTAANSDIKNDLVEKGGFFSNKLKEELRNRGYRQIHRNFLLTYAYAKKHGMTNFANIIISPEEDKLSGIEISEMQREMTAYSDRILKISLQEFVSRGKNCGQQVIMAVMDKFWDRYLDY